MSADKETSAAATTAAVVEEEPSQAISTATTDTLTKAATSSSPEPSSSSQATKVTPSASSTTVESNNNKEPVSPVPSPREEEEATATVPASKPTAAPKSTKTTAATNASSSSSSPSDPNAEANEESKEKKRSQQDAEQSGRVGESTNINNNNKKRPAAEQGPPPGLPAQPIKAARTAYFIFAAEKREEIKKSHPGEPVGVIARVTGQLWSTLTDEEKAVYQGRAAEERERVAQEIAKCNLDAIHLGGSGDSVAKDPLALEIPLARLKKIVKLDPEVKGVSREAMLLLGKAAELVTAKLGVEAVKVASLQNRRKLLPDDVAQICQTREKFLFLKDDVKDLLKEQHLEKKAAAASKAAAAAEATAAESSNSKPLTAYFGVKS